MIDEVLKEVISRITLLVGTIILCGIGIVSLVTSNLLIVLVVMIDVSLLITLYEILYYE